MSAEVVNRFTFDVLNQLYHSQNSTGNIAFCGTALYLMMGAISVGLRGRSHQKLSEFLHRNVDQSIDNEVWVNSESAKSWSELKNKSLVEKWSKIFINIPGQLSAHYKRILSKIFRRNHDMSADEINALMERHVVSHNILNIVKKSMVSEIKILFISTVYFQLEWDGEFYLYPDKGWFVRDDGKFLVLEMIYRLAPIRIYVSPEKNFRIIFQTMNKRDFLFVIVIKSFGQSIGEMLNSFKVEQLPTYLDQSEQDFVNLVLPKFQITAAHDFVPALMKLGLTDIFYRNDTDFGRITNHSVMMENLIQVTSFSVDEFGINTYKSHYDISTPSEVHELRVDRTFLFLLYSIEHNLVHFSALVNNPTADYIQQ